MTENLEINGNVILWSLGKKRWVLSYEELTPVYLSGKHPYTGADLSTATLNKILTMIKQIAGAWWVPELKKIKNYRKIPLSKLQTIKSGAGKKLGNGKYATVYLYNGYAVKVINHRFYKHLPRIDGAVEAKIQRLLTKKLVYTFACPNIITTYQYIADKRTDYIVMEKLEKTFWTMLQSDPDPKIIKGVLLQVLFTLAVLHHELPKFRHNDLKVDNILLDYTPRKQRLTLRYKKYFWVLPSNVPLVKIADFDYSCLPGVCDNPKVGTEHAMSFGCTKTPSSIYDLHLFLNSFYSYRGVLTPETSKWLLAQLPEPTRGNENKAVRFGRLKEPKDWEGQIRTPLHLLIGHFFSEFRTIKPSYPLWGIR
jgi:hypothetical protein